MESDFARTVWWSSVGLVALSASDSVLENARSELTFSAMRNWRNLIAVTRQVVARHAEILEELGYWRDGVFWICRESSSIWMCV